MRRLALLPLDERPCNYRYPQLLGPVAGVEVLVPPPELMGHKKRPADTGALAEWLLEAAERADGVVVAAETLAFGGLIPSRVVDVTEEQAIARLGVLKEIRRRHPALPVFVQSVILRTPAYDSDDEEPAYWATYGERLHLYSVLLHALDLGEAAWEQARRSAPPSASAMVAAALRGLSFDGLRVRRAELEAEIPPDVREDWRWRRSRNHRVNRELVHYAAEGIVDFVALTQDDSFPLGLHAQEQRALTDLIAERRAFRRVLIYPGADEVGLVLLARHVLKAAGLRPRVALRFSSAVGPQVVPRYEDRPLLEGIKGHLTALGGLWEPDFGACDIALFVNSPDGPQQEAPHQHLPGAMGSGRNLPEFLEALAAALAARPERPVALADVAYANGADRALVEMLPAYVWPFDLAAYAGWNTAGNTIGSALAHAALRWVGLGQLGGEEAARAERAHRSYLSLRFAEDWAYQAVVRQEMARGPVAALGISPYALGAHRQALAGEALERLRATWQRWQATWQPELALRPALPGQPGQLTGWRGGESEARGRGGVGAEGPAAADGRTVSVRLTALDFPWDRLFEVALSVEVD